MQRSGIHIIKYHTDPGCQSGGKLKWAWPINLFIRIRVTDVTFHLGKSSPHIPKGRFSSVVFYKLTDVEDPEDAQTDLCRRPSSSKHRHLNFLETNMNISAIA